MSTFPDIDSLRQRWQALKQEQPRLRARDAAQQLNISEAQLVALSCGDSVVRLRADWPEIIGRIPELGFVMALTRNDAVVHERKGVYENVSSTPVHGLVVGEDIDLRLFWQAWHSGFAVRTDTARGPLESFQFFDTYGTAIHKIYLTQRSNREAYERIVEEFRHDDQTPVETVQPEPVEDHTTVPENVDVAAFRAGWAALRDTHDFFPLITSFGLTRHQALQLAGEEYAYRVAPSSARSTLNAAAAQGAEIMVFVGNRGAIQIHTGRVRHLLQMEEWFNVMDPEFNLHLREPDIAEAWVVRKPTDDGIVTSLELFGPTGDNIAMLFGKRKPGSPELESWRDIIRLLRPLSESSAIPEPL